MGRDDRVPAKLSAPENSNKTTQSGPVCDWKEHQKLFFKTGALNHSATLPVLEFHPLSSAFPRTQRDSGTCLGQRSTESCAKSIWSGRFDGGGAAQGAESMMPS